MNKVRLLLFVLVVMLAILVLIFQNSISVEGELTVIYQQEEYKLSSDDISALAKHSIHTERGSTHRAYKLTEILDYLEISTQEIEQISVSSIDGMKLNVKRTEMKDLYLEPEDISGTFRLIIPPDTFAQRWLKNVHKIELQ